MYIIEYEVKYLRCNKYEYPITEIIETKKCTFLKIYRFFYFQKVQSH